MNTFRRSIQRILVRAVNAHEPGVAIGISQQGRVLLTASRGKANLTAAAPITSATPFRICSISKQFISALVWREIEAGRISIDVHPGLYVEWLSQLDSSMRVVHLLQNKSGIRDQWVMAMWMGARAEQRFTLDDGNEVVQRAPMSMFAPGSQSLYCNANFELLGQILEAVSGESFASALQTHILTPLGMRDTFVGVDTADSLREDARGYRWHRGAWIEEVNAVHWQASAGIVSTVEDLLKWDRCLRNPVLAGMPWVERIKTAFAFSDGAPATYASGINHRVAGNRHLLTHTGALRGWRASLSRFEPEDTSIVVFMNRNNSPNGGSLRAIAGQVAEAVGVRPIWQSEVSSARRRAKLAHAGSYLCRAQGVLLQMANRAGHAHAHLQGGWTPLFETAERGVMESEDGHLQIRFERGGKLLVRIAEANVCMRMQRLRETTQTIAARGAFVCAPLDSELIIHRRGTGLLVQFVGVFGSGVRYKLTSLNRSTAWFEIARGVDESPPGRVLMLFDAASTSVELSCPLARRVVFRARG